MRRDHRPFYIKRLFENFQKWYGQHFVKPHLEYLGPEPQLVNPWYIEIFGPSVSIGSHCNIVTTKDRHVKLNIWGKKAHLGSINIGNYVFIGPGVRISAYNEINIGDNVLIAAGVYITDSDWHGVYNRVELPDEYTPVNIGNNVWLGDHATVVKGVTIGENSVVGACSVVTKDVPANVIVAGNPAKIVKHLDPNEPMVTREMLFGNPDLHTDVERMDRERLAQNSLLHWLMTYIKPPKDI